MLLLPGTRGRISHHFELHVGLSGDPLEMIGVPALRGATREART